jgi:NADPH:quinone reductase-like Zn-dependent oxidoreductase
MRAVQITRFGGPELLDIVAIPEPAAGPGRLYDVCTAGLNVRRHPHYVSAN